MFLFGLLAILITACGGGNGGPDGSDRVLSVSIDQGNTTLAPGGTLQLTATVETSGAAPTSVTWTSSNTAVATVSAGGAVTAIAEGTSQITATSTFDTSRSDTVTITVSEGGGPGPGPGTCRHTLSGNITTPSLLVNGGEGCDYLLEGSVRVTTELRVEPGTIVVAASDSRIVIDDAGRIIADGTAEERISFIGQVGVQGSWYGFCFSGTHLESVFNHVDIFWAGKVWTGGSQVCRAGIGSVNDGGEPVHITNSVIVGAYTTGIDATEIRLGNFSNNILAGHREYGLRTSPNNMGRLDDTTNYGGGGVTLPGGQNGANGRQFVFVNSGVLDIVGETQYWQPLDVPYTVDRDDFPYSTASLRIDEGSTAVLLPGTTMIMGPEALIMVEFDGILVLSGEPDDPVRLIGQPQMPGTWEGIWMYGGGLFAEYAEISFGGSESIVLEGNITFQRVYGPSHCSHLRNVTIRGSSTYGISVGDDYEPFVHLENMTYENNAWGDVHGDPHGPPVLNEGVSCSG